MLAGPDRFMVTHGLLLDFGPNHLEIIQMFPFGNRARIAGMGQDTRPEIKVQDRMPGHLAASECFQLAIAGVAAVPVVGMFAAPTMTVSFEKAVFEDWKKENPDKDFENYACETGDTTAEVFDETLQFLPESLRPPADFIGSWMPECGVALEEQSWFSADTK